jgi:hypothetical protein
VKGVLDATVHTFSHFHVLRLGGCRQPALTEYDKDRHVKSIFKSASVGASTAAGPLHEFYDSLLVKGMKPSMARLTLARKIAAITLIVWKKGARFDGEHLKPQACPSPKRHQREIR